jgi:DNA-binding CsgD family transcriptional regulator
VAFARGGEQPRGGDGLVLTEKTVEFHLTSVYGKLGVRGRTELVRRVAGLPLGR